MAYVDGELSGSARRKFLTRLRRNAALKREVAELAALHALLHQIDSVTRAQQAEGRSPRPHNHAMGPDPEPGARPSDNGLANVHDQQTTRTPASRLALAASELHGATLRP